MLSCYFDIQVYVQYHEVLHVDRNPVVVNHPTILQMLRAPSPTWPLLNYPSFLVGRTLQQ